MVKDNEFGLHVQPWLLVTVFVVATLVCFGWKTYEKRHRNSRG